MRTAAVIAYLVTIIPFHGQSRPLRTFPLTAQLALLALVIGLVFPIALSVDRKAR